MVSCDDYRKADGHIDWNTLRAAERAAGERCMSCGEFIFPGAGHPAECHSCQSLRTDRGEVSHERRARCPRCERIVDMTDGEYSGDLYHDEDVKVWCPECDEQFRVGVRVSVTFVSSAVGSERSEDED